jgi:hypothetical protein
VLINELPEGLPGMFGLPIAPGLTWPVVDPGGLAPWTERDNPDALPVEFDSPDALPIEEAPADPPAVPRAPPACASAIELENASPPANTIVASLMIVSLVVELNGQLSETIDVPATRREVFVCGFPR